MLLEHPFEVITPTVDGAVLAVLAGAEAEFTPGEVHRLAGDRSLSGIRNALNRLVAQGIVHTQRRGPSYTYKLNRGHLAADAVITLACLREEFVNRLMKAFEQLPVRPVYAALFGSAARNDMVVESDIDIFVVKPDKLTESQEADWTLGLEEIEAKVHLWTGNDVSLYVGQVAEVRTNVEALFDAVRQDGLRLAGSRTFWDDL